MKALGVACVAGLTAWIAAGAGPGGAVALAQAQQKASAQIIEAGRAALQEFAKGVPTAGTPGLTAPKVLKSPNPKYTPDELRAKTEGTVVLHAIIGTDGRVERSQVWRSLNSALDAQALDALSTWVFAPGRLNDAPTRVAVEVQMSFRVHKD
jgi:protein TonB